MTRAARCPVRRVSNASRGRHSASHAPGTERSSSPSQWCGPRVRAPTGARRPTGANERRALLGVIFHAGALEQRPLSEVVAAVDRHEPDEARAALARHGADRALDLLEGILATEGREQSGIWSTASGVLAGYRTDAALASTTGRSLDVDELLTSRGTLYICAGSDHQRHAAPLVAGLLREVRSAAYERSLSATLAVSGEALRAVASGAYDTSTACRPRRAGEHRSPPRSPDPRCRRRQPGRRDAGLPAGPRAGPCTVGPRGGRVPVAVRDKARLSRNRRHTDPRGGVAPRRRARSADPVGDARTTPVRSSRGWARARPGPCRCARTAFSR